MVPLMERIAWQLCDCVELAINVQTLFKYVQTLLSFSFKKHRKCIPFYLCQHLLEERFTHSLECAVDRFNALCLKQG